MNGPVNPERDPETVTLFVEESLDGLQRVERLLLEAEQGRPAADLVPALFREMHTIKGTSGFLGFGNLQALSHASEDLLGKLRDKTVQARPELYWCLVDVADRLRGAIERIREGGDDADLEVTPLIDRLCAIGTTGGGTVVPVAAFAAAPLDPSAKADASDGTVRVSVGVLDRLMNLIGELVLARNQIVQSLKVSRDVDPMGQTACQRLDAVTSDLQDQVMKTRMQPISRVFEKVPRMVRDLVKATNKQVATHIHGTGTEIDKALVDAVRDPLMHIVRNAIDHGIEMPDERVARGKAAIGRLSVRASHEGSMVKIEVEDDGRGMDPAALRRHAVARDLLRPAEAEALSDSEALDLIFRPGFSTAAKVTAISGRGVGMDVVRTHVERAGGHVVLSSTPGQGTTICLTMPLTLAIIPVLLVRVRDYRFAIPQANLVELLFVGEQSRVVIEHVRGAPIFRLRGDVLPLVDLSSVLELGAAEPGGARAHDANIVVVGVGDQRYGLLVDAIEDTEEIVIKPLHAVVKCANLYAGAAVLGDGAVALILELKGVAARAGLDVSPRRAAPVAVLPIRREGDAAILFRVGNDAQCAVPLSMVARLERVPPSSIERVAGAEVVQYREGVMPVLRPEAVLPLGASPASGLEQPLIVLRMGRSVALAVSEVVDVVDLPPGDMAANGETPYTLATLVLGGRTTLVLDVHRIVRELAPSAAKRAA